MYSLLIKNATVIDGTGKPGEILDIAVEKDEIVNVAKNITTASQTIIDGTGLVVAPGFIDVQNHSDSYWQIFDNPALGSLTTQGYTTILLGNCGASLAPLLSSNALLSIQKWHGTEGLNINWQTFPEYIETLSRQPKACNVATLVGYSTLRRGIIGDAVRALAQDELNALQKVLSDCLKAGAFGMSTGLSYAHEISISEIELYEMAKVVSANNGLFSIHLRSEASHVSEAVTEALDIARNTKVNLKISHLKVKGSENYRKFPEVVSAIETAYHEGYNVHFDTYPYDTTWQALYSYLPQWAMEGGRTAMLKNFADPAQKNKILMHLNNSGVRFPQVMVASTTNKLNFSGKTIGQIAKNLEVSSEQAVLHLIENGGSEVLVFEQNLDPDQLQQLVLHPLGFIATDGGGFSANPQDVHRLVHPRCFGTAQKFLEFSVKRNIISLEQAIYKLTLAPAKKIGLQKRGEIKVGNFADLVVFDPGKIAERATYENPYQYSEGMEYVFVNGKAVVTKGKPTDQLPGYALRKE